MTFSPYSQSNVITLGSLEYIIDGRVSRNPAEEFAAGLRMGSPDYDARQGSFFRNFNDFRGGMGVRVGDVRQYPDRFWASRDVRTWDSSQDVTLAPLLVEATLGAIVPSYPATTPGPGAAWAVAPDSAGAYTLYGATGNRVFKNTSTAAPAFTAITPGGGPASAQTFGLLQHTNPTDLTDRALFWSTGSSADIWKYSLSAGTWSQPLAGAKADHIIEFDRKLLKVYAGQVSISANGGTSWVDIVKVQSDTNFAPFFAGVGLDSFGQLMPYLVCSGRLYAIDVWTYQAVELDIGLPSNVTAAVVWQDGEVVATDGYYVKAYHPSRPVKDMGFNRDNGLQTLAFIRSFTTVAGKYLIANVDVSSNLFNLFMWDGIGWHVVTGSDGIFGPFGLWPNPGHDNMVMYNGASVYSPAQQMYIMSFAAGTWHVYYMNCDAFKNPQLNGAHSYAGTLGPGYIITPWFDGGFAEMPGTAIEFEVHGIFNGNAKKLTIKYRIDNDESAWQTLGSTSGTSTVQRFQFASGKGISFKNIQFEFDLYRDSTATNTPVIRALVFKYLKVPRLRSQFGFTVDVEHTARHRGVSEETVIDTLYALVDDTPLTDFGYIGESTFFVRFVAMPREDAARQDGTTKTSMLRVTIEEPV